MKETTKQNIILIGFMGCGKTSVGERLAGCLSYQFKDTDQLIVKKTGDTISKIFEKQGEEYFRNLETDLLIELQPSLTHTVLSTGGGLPLRKQNMKLMQQLGQVIYLRTSKETIADRLKGDTTRPLLQGDDYMEKIERMLLARSTYYERAAHHIIDTDDRTVDELVTIIGTMINDQCRKEE